MNEKLSLRLAESVTSYYKPGMMQWHYQDGLVVFSVYKVAKAYNREDLKLWAVSMYDRIIDNDGNIENYRLGEFNLDQINAGRLLFDLYKETDNEKYLKAEKTLEEQLKKQPRTKSGIFWHKEIYPWQVWLDGLYMQGPFWTMAGNFEDVAEQYIKVYNTLKDDKTGLLYHAWDESRGQRWSDINTGLSPHFWSRSLGWYLMGCIDCYELAENQSPAKKEKLAEIIKNLLVSVYSVQDKTGMWFQVPDLPEEKGNYLETSGSSMFCYTALKAARLGICDKYVQKAKKGIEAISDIYLKQKSGVYHLGGICSVAGLGGNPYRDGSLKYYFCEPVVEDDFKGTGPFILANLENENSQV